MSATESTEYLRNMFAYVADALGMETEHDDTGPLGLVELEEQIVEYAIGSDLVEIILEAVKEYAVNTPFVRTGPSFTN